MFPNNLPKKQKGFLIPLSIFIVVVMGLFALVLSRNTIQSSTSAGQEIISAEAFYAAESGAQRGMQRLFFPDASARQQVDQRCVDMITTPISITIPPLVSGTPSVPGLQNCSMVATCACAFADGSSCSPITASNYTAAAAAGRLTSFYTITSVGTCGAGTIKSVRTIDVGSFMKQE